METRLEAKDKEMESRLDTLESKVKEDKDELEKLKESSFRKEMVSNNALTNPSLRDLAGLQL